MIDKYNNPCIWILLYYISDDCFRFIVEGMYTYVWTQDISFLNIENKMLILIKSNGTLFGINTVNGIDIVNK